MKAPLSWLREFVPVEADPAELADRLSMAGVTVEAVVRSGEGISGVVVGEVREVREHPNADNLVLVRAFDGDVERDIVCGARNFSVGDRVPLARPGAQLPGGIEIGQRRVRGETSDGMLCSARELRISEDHAGILVLDPDVPLGKDLVQALELDDAVFDLDITTNRGDLLSIVGIAREIAALYGLPLRIPDAAPQEASEETAALASVEVRDRSGCPRYVARAITGVRIGASPWWIRRRLLACGMRPITNVVDVTNYVLLERGQPLHAFDLETLRGARIVVRRPRKGERILTLDGVERELAREDVVIADAERAVAIAGVMGGADTEVSDATRTILLESATFDPLRVRATAARLGLRTEASARFEKGSDPALPPGAASRAAELLAAVAGGTVARGAIDVTGRLPRPRPIKMRMARASMTIGAEQDPAFAERVLRALGCEVRSTRAAITATPPSWRPDLTEEVDLIEEVARYYGYDTPPSRLPPGGRAGGLTEQQRARRTIATVLRGSGLSEAQTLSLIPPWIPERLSLPDDHPLRTATRVANPLSEEESVLRPSLLPGLLLAARRNVARRVLPVLLFELGTVFRPGDGGVEEELEVAWVMTGPAPRGWLEPERALDLFDAKGVLERLAGAVGARSLSVLAARPDALLSPARAAEVRIGDAAVGGIGEVHPAAAEALELPQRVAVGWLRVDAILESSSGSQAVVPPRFPGIARDLALVVPDDVAASAVEAVIRQEAGELLEGIELFDVYRGEPVAAGARSLAFGLSFRAPDRTLSDAEADDALARVTTAAARAGWTVRA